MRSKIRLKFKVVYGEVRERTSQEFYQCIPSVTLYNLGYNVPACMYFNAEINSAIVLSSGSFSHVIVRIYILQIVADIRK